MIIVPPIHIPVETTPVNPSTWPTDTAHLIPNMYPILAWGDAFTWIVSISVWYFVLGIELAFICVMVYKRRQGRKNHE